MRSTDVVVQPTLPGIESAERTPPARRRVATRVWHDPAVLESRARADRRYSEWRLSFASFVASLPARRRAELRSRLRLAGSSPRDTQGRGLGP